MNDLQWVRDFMGGLIVGIALWLILTNLRRWWRIWRGRRGTPPPPA